MFTQSFWCVAHDSGAHKTNHFTNEWIRSTPIDAAVNVYFSCVVNSQWNHFIAVIVKMRLAGSAIKFRRLFHLAIVVHAQERARI